MLNDYEKGYRLIASAYHNDSGRLMEVYSDQPGLQFYTGHFLGFCLETEHFPNSPNQPEFPSVTLNPDEKYYSKTSYKFKIKE